LFPTKNALLLVWRRRKSLKVKTSSDQMDFEMCLIISCK
jgi:hypothetical protein